MSRHPNIVGMKDGTKENMSVYVNAIPKEAEFYILAGTISKFYTGLLEGGVGGVLSMANFPSRALLRTLRLVSEKGTRERNENA